MRHSLLYLSRLSYLMIDPEVSVTKNNQITDFEYLFKHSCKFVSLCMNSRTMGYIPLRQILRELEMLISSRSVSRHWVLVILLVRYFFVIQIIWSKIKIVLRYLPALFTQWKCCWVWIEEWWCCILYHLQSQLF